MDRPQFTSDSWFVGVIWQKCRSELIKRPQLYAGVVLGVIAFAAMFYWPVKVTSTGKMTDLQQVLFQMCIVAFSVFFSWILAKKSEETNILAKQRALASSAVRRISGILAAATRLGAAIEVRKEAVKAASVWRDVDPVRALLIWEYFDSLGKHVTEMRDNIVASENDWRDILPEEFAKKEEIESEIRQAEEGALHERKLVLDKLEHELNANILQGQLKNSEQRAALAKNFRAQLESVSEKLSLKIQDIRSQLPPTLGSPYSLVTADPAPRTTFNIFDRNTGTGSAIDELERIGREGREKQQREHELFDALRQIAKINENLKPNGSKNEEEKK